MNKAIFLDRDGVINQEIGNYITCLEEFKLLDHAITHIARLHQAGYKIIVITNQGGIAKGLYTHDILHGINLHMLDEIDQSLDKASVDSFADIVKFFQKDFTILVITHNDRLKNKFANGILVEQDLNMISKARVVNSW